MTKGLFSFNNSELDKSKPHKSIKERVIIVCPVCNQPSKCFIQMVVNKGQRVFVKTTLDGTCGNNKCKAKIKQLVSVTLEYK